jgi:hypothetical protein
MRKESGIPALCLILAILVPVVAFGLQAASTVQEEVDALEAAMFAAVWVVSAEEAERTASERLNSYRNGTPRSHEEESRDTDALAWWTRQGLSPVGARRADIQHWEKERERRELHFQQQASIYSEIAAVSIETAVERALAARDEYLSQFTVEDWSRMQASRERFEQWKLRYRQALLEKRQQILDGLDGLDAVGSDGLSIRARACGQALRERVEQEVVQPTLDPERHPTIHREGLVDQAVGAVRAATEKTIHRVEQEIAETGEWGPCAHGDDGMRAAYLALGELR